MEREREENLNPAAVNLDDFWWYLFFQHWEVQIIPSKWTMATHLPPTLLSNYIQLNISSARLLALDIDLTLSAHLRHFKLWGSVTTLLLMRSTKVDLQIQRWLLSVLFNTCTRQYSTITVFPLFSLNLFPGQFQVLHWKLLPPRLCILYIYHECSHDYLLLLLLSLT